MTLRATAAGAESAWVGEVLRFWFEELEQDQWFASTKDMDARIRDRFEALWARLAAQAESLDRTPRTVLAAVIVLDQFPRNMFRGTARAFQTDPIALRLARDGVGRHLDAAMSTAERHFLYLPFQHSENREDQARSVELIGALGNEEWTRYAIAHRQMIEQFGRFPHRNAILSRPSTAQETLQLKIPTDW